MTADPLDEVPRFGAAPPGITVVVRPSAWAIIARGSAIAVTRTPEALYLPGGGIEAGEMPEEAVVREAVEECGLVVRPGAWRVRAVEIVRAARSPTWYEKHGTIMDAAIVGDVRAPTESDHVLEWMTPDEAMRALHHASHRWAVERWLGHVRG